MRRTKCPGKQVSVYLAYPTEERIRRLREYAKTWNEIDKLKYRRLSKVGNKKELDLYLMEDKSMKEKLDKRYKETQIRKKRKQFIESVKEIALAIKNSKA